MAVRGLEPWHAGQSGIGLIAQETGIRLLARALSLLTSDSAPDPAPYRSHLAPGPTARTHTRTPIPASVRSWSSVRAREAAATFSSRCAIEVVPGIGRMFGER